MRERRSCIGAAAKHRPEEFRYRRLDDILHAAGTAHERRRVQIGGASGVINRAVSGTIVVTSVLVLYGGWANLKVLGAVILGPVVAMVIGQVFAASLAAYAALSRPPTTREVLRIVRCASRFLLVCLDAGRSRQHAHLASAQRASCNARKARSRHRCPGSLSETTMASEQTSGARGGRGTWHCDRPWTEPICGVRWSRASA